MGLALPVTQAAWAPACGQSQRHFCRVGKTDPLWHQGVGGLPARSPLKLGKIIQENVSHTPRRGVRVNVWSSCTRNGNLTLNKGKQRGRGKQSEREGKRR